MRDLEIRGAGNLLGDEQSGHVAAVGFELYCQMLDEATEQLRQERAGEEGAAAGAAPEPVRLDVDVDAYVPAEYVPYEAAKIDIHRGIAAAARDRGDLAALRAELEDRFGPPPEPVEHLGSTCSAPGSSSAPPGPATSSSAAAGSRSARSSSTPIRSPSSASSSRRPSTNGATRTVALRVPQRPPGSAVASLPWRYRRAGLERRLPRYSTPPLRLRCMCWRTRCKRHPQARIATVFGAIVLIAVMVAAVLAASARPGPQATVAVVTGTEITKADFDGAP